MSGRTRALRLHLIPEALHDLAIRALNEGDAEGFLGRASNEDGLALLSANRRALQERGIYEPALLSAYIGTRTNNVHVPISTLRSLFAAADRTRLRAAGEPLPAAQEFALYRGVSGHGAERRVRGYSWTASLDVARWFAERYALEDPAVYAVNVEAEDVLAYTHDAEAGGRQEAEFIVELPRSVRPRRLGGGERP